MNSRTSRVPHPSDEQGIALVLAMLILTVFAIALQLRHLLHEHEFTLVQVRKRHRPP
jgi:hypothetical protein